jgi:hypothetical protein
MFKKIPRTARRSGLPRRRTPRNNGVKLLTTSEESQ